MIWLKVGDDPTHRILEELITLFAAFRVDWFVTEADWIGHRWVGFIDKTDGLAIWFRLIRGRFYFDGRVDPSTLDRFGLIRHDVERDEHGTICGKITWLP